MRACRSGVGCGPYSTNKRIVVSLAPPSLSAPSTASEYTYFSVGWTSITHATRYELQRNGVTKQNNSLTNYSNSLTAGTYSYRVRACNTNGCSGWSNTDSTTVYNTGGCGPLGCTDPYFTDPGDGSDGNGKGNGKPADPDEPVPMSEPVTDGTDGEGI